MAGFKYRGKTTGHLYEFSQPLFDAEGHAVIGGPFSIATYNGEHVVYCNNDGSVAMPTAGPTPVDQPFGGSVTPSPWEQA